MSLETSINKLTAAVSELTRVLNKEGQHYCDECLEETGDPEACLRSWLLSNHSEDLQYSYEQFDRADDALKSLASCDVHPLFDVLVEEGVLDVCTPYSITISQNECAQLASDLYDILWSDADMSGFFDAAASIFLN